MVQPTSVTVTAIPAASAVPEAASTMELLPGDPGVRPTPNVARYWAVGVEEVAKKPEG
jgi:hypothetical protein